MGFKSNREQMARLDRQIKIKERELYDRLKHESVLATQQLQDGINELWNEHGDLYLESLVNKLKRMIRMGRG